MSRDLDLEGDSPNSSVNLGNDDIDGLNNDNSLKRQTRAVTLKSLSHKSESVHSFTPFLKLSADESVKEVSKTRIHRATDLVRQPNRWETEPLRVVGPDTRGSKATPKSMSSSNLSVHPISSSSTAGDGLNILSEAFAAISTPRLHVSKDLSEFRPDRDDYSPSRRTHLPPSSEWILEAHSRRVTSVRQFRDPSSTTRSNREVETKFATVIL